MTRHGLLAALAAASLWLAASAGAQSLDLDLAMNGTGSLKSKGLGTLKVPVALLIHMYGTVEMGYWSATDQDLNAFHGTYYPVKGRKNHVQFDGDSLALLGDVLEQEVAQDTGLSAQAQYVTLRPAFLKIDKKGHATLKLVFDIT